MFRGLWKNTFWVKRCQEQLNSGSVFSQSHPAEKSKKSQISPVFLRLQTSTAFEAYPVRSDSPMAVAPQWAVDSRGGKGRHIWTWLMSYWYVWYIYIYIYVYIYIYHLLILIASKLEYVCGSMLLSRCKICKMIQIWGLKCSLQPWDRRVDRQHSSPWKVIDASDFYQIWDIDLVQISLNI